VTDPGGGQGSAVQAGLDGLEPGGILVVNADVPCVVPHDLRSLLAATPAGSLALVEALDGTTNALSLPTPEAFAPLYGPDSSDRFREHAASLGLEAVSVALPNLADDVDTMEDLTRLGLRAGPRTQACLAELEGSVV
jgi:2-phospho-L-lactate guanylyltransferase (CobY/MobA/RfbA family)